MTGWGGGRNASPFGSCVSGRTSVGGRRLAHACACSYSESGSIARTGARAPGTAGRGGARGVVRPAERVDRVAVVGVRLVRVVAKGGGECGEGGVEVRGRTVRVG